MAKVPLNVRVNPEIRKEIQKIAEQENRTLSNLVETLLLNHIRKKHAPQHRRG